MEKEKIDLHLLFYQETGNKGWHAGFEYWMEEKLEREMRRVEVYKRLARIRGNLLQKTLQKTAI